MFRPRIIPVLLLKNQGLVKSVQFKKYNYIGDPINAVRIFNDLRADELVFLDTEASLQNRTISIELIKEIGHEANMPFAVGGGIKSISEIRACINAGAEKVVLNTIALENPEFIKQASDEFGSSTISVCIDVKKVFLGKLACFTRSGSQKYNLDPFDFAFKMQDFGAGEIIIQSIDKDGAMSGYDIPLIRKLSEKIEIPLVALGGAGEIMDLKKAFKEGKASALAAGSLFVYQSKMKGVLINYPNTSDF